MVDVNAVKCVIPDMIEGYIVSEVYFTVGDGVRGANEAQTLVSKPEGGVIELGPLSLLTFCVLVLKNGFTVTGQSACADPSKFDREIGRRVARENAVEAIWPLMGYALRNVLSGENGLL